MLAIYSPEVPPRRGGVADQTLALATTLAGRGQPPLVLAAHGDPARFGAVPCVTGIAPLDAPATAAGRGARRLLLQYVPFLYARSGVAPALRRLPARCREAGVALELFVHEPYVPLTRLPWLVTGLPQRLQLRALVRGASRVYTPVPAYAEAIRRWAADGVAVTVAPVGASLPVAEPAAREAARQRLGLAPGHVAVGAFSPGAAGFRADWLRAAAQRLAGDAQVRWVLFGSGSTSLTGMPEGTIVVRETDARTVAETMRALDVAAQPFVDGLTLRRTSAMLALATGIATVSSTGPLFDPAAGALAACEADRDAFAERIAGLVRDPAERAAAAARTAGYRDRASVEALADLVARGAAA